MSRFGLGGSYACRRDKLDNQVRRVEDTKGKVKPRRKNLLGWTKEPRQGR